MQNKLIIAHRGASNFAHENTLEAFAKAIEIGADVVELDVRKTKDGVLVCFHDKDIEGKKLSDIEFSELNFHAQKQKFSVPTLESAFALMAGKILVHVELKETSYEQEVVSLAKKHLTVKEFCIISFNFSSLEKIKLANREIQTGLILGARKKRIWATIKFVFRQKQMARFLDMMALNYELFVFGLHNVVFTPIPLGVWTVDESGMMEKLFKNPKVWALTSNKPDLALKVRENL